MLANTKRILTEEQREQWAVDGYLQIEGALSPAETDFFSKLLGDVPQQAGFRARAGRTAAHYAWKLPDQNVDAFGSARSAAIPLGFIDLIDRPACST